MKPFRFQMDFTYAADDLDRAIVIHDRIMELADGMKAHYEGGGVGLMPAEEVIPDSPLAKDLSVLDSGRGK